MKPHLFPKTKTAARVASLVFSLAVFSIGLIASGQTTAELPNVIIMMADDMGVGDTSAYQDWTGNLDPNQVKTPSMVQLAKRGIRFTDAHSPSSRCTATRQALLTGRYTWRTRLKFSVLWGPQGDPLIEPDRVTLGTMLQNNGYRTGMSGKWHCGLTYRNAEGAPESNYQNVDLTQGIADGPLDHGFDFFHGTSRSHPTSKDQGWLAGSRVPAAQGGIQVDRAKYILNETGPTNFTMAKKFLDNHLSQQDTSKKPFFLYYACHSNHTSHDPCKEIEGRQVKGKSHPGGKRSDFIYENDVVLGLLIDYLQQHDDPRRQGHDLIDNTLLIFTSDNGAESRAKMATGPLRSNKGSIYEGGHRVPFIASWPLGGVGNGDPNNDGKTSSFPICHVDVLATLAEIVGTSISANNGEDSFSILSALKDNPPSKRTAIIHNDHNEGARQAGKKAKDPEAAWIAIRIDNPVVNGKRFPGQWKMLADHQLLIDGKLNPRELYELSTDLKEQTNRINDPMLKPLVNELSKQLQTIHDSGRIQ
ncbi:arylsulfatase [bacterium]|nr:arylsulfatase [bacterium]